MPRPTFTLANKLGEGAFGSVSTVYRDSDGHEFACKCFAPSEDDGTVECGTIRELSILIALQGEAQGVGNAPHPHIMPVAAITRVEGLDGFCMIMPKMCMTLSTAITSKALGRDAVLSVALGVVEALHFLHGNHIIHRDVKPDNVLLDASFVPVLADFSLAKVIGGEPETSLQESAESRKALAKAKAASAQEHGVDGGDLQTSGVGTPTYMAPEVVQGNGQYTLAADMWSVGVVLYELFNGKLLEVTKDKAAFRLLAEQRTKMSTTKPVPVLLRRLIDPDPARRASASTAAGELSGLVTSRATASSLPASIELPTFRSWARGELPTLPQEALGTSKRINESLRKRQRTGKAGKTQSQNDLQLARACCERIGAVHKLTAPLAAEVARRTGGKIIDAAVLCSKLTELELADLAELENEDQEHLPETAQFDYVDFVEEEVALFEKMGFNLYSAAATGAGSILPAAAEDSGLCTV